MEKEKLYEVRLTYDELMVLDGKVKDSSQAIIDTAKKERSYDLPIQRLREVVMASEKTSKLTWTRKNIRECPLCEKKHDYNIYPRSGRHHRKGEKNFNSPKLYPGIEFNQGFVVFSGFGDCCKDCFENKKIKEMLIDFILGNDLKIEIQKNDYKQTRYKKDIIRVCYQCNADMRESKMGMLPAVFEGYYPGQCPSCGAKSLPFGKSHNLTSRFVMIESLTPSAA